MKRESHIHDSKDELKRCCDKCNAVINYMKGEKLGAWKIRKRDFKRLHKKCKPTTVATTVRED